MIAGLAISCSDSAAPPSTPASLQIVSGDAQKGTVGAQLREALAVRVLDGHKEALAGVPVNWVVTGGDGLLSSPTVVTNSDGIAEDQWILGTSTSENQTVEARVAIDESRGLRI